VIRTRDVFCCGSAGVRRPTANASGAHSPGDLASLPGEWGSLQLPMSCHIGWVRIVYRV